MGAMWKTANKRDLTKVLRNEEGNRASQQPTTHGGKKEDWSSRGSC
jgi:hypothetical protein